MRLLADLLVVAGLLGMGLGLYMPSESAPRPAWRNVLVFQPIWKQRANHTATGWKFYAGGVVLLGTGLLTRAMIALA